MSARYIVTALGHGRVRHGLCALGIAVLLAAPLCLPASTWAQSQRDLLVCADPNNLPFSNDKLEGFENKIASLIAEDLGAKVRYTWSDQRRGFLRRTLHAHRCDLVMGVPAGLPGVSITEPYYTSSYVFVWARERNLQLAGFDDPVLGELKIGLEAIGVEGANTPPASALARRGLTSHVVGFTKPEAGEIDTRAARIVDAVASKEIDTAIVWGPFGGYYAKRYADKLAIAPIVSDPKQPSLALAFSIALGVRSEDEAFKAELQGVLDRRHDEIRAILRDYGVPLVMRAPSDGEAMSAAGAAQ
ncbi:MAG TPA: quinoprotein dehydrogenase-associated putative ABC transporter substrate-binding protein [Burkholderiales bacterium]|nr:quinoprotein dehydrogenase-associated putative ABC transporter substrate-binding protein [Burkholderiales bacterium]